MRKFGTRLIEILRGTPNDDRAWTIGGINPGGVDRVGLAVLVDCRSGDGDRRGLGLGPELLDYIASKVVRGE